MNSNDIESRSEFALSLDAAIKETEERIFLFSSMHVFQVILGQLKTIERIILDEKRMPSFEEREQITMGNIALKSFKDEDPEYANRLMDLGYRFYYYEELPD